MLVFRGSYIYSYSYSFQRHGLHLKKKVDSGRHRTCLIETKSLHPKHYAKQAVDSWAFLLVEQTWKVVVAYYSNYTKLCFKSTEWLNSVWGRSLVFFLSGFASRTFVRTKSKTHLVALGLCNALLWGWPLSKWCSHLFWNLRTHCLLVAWWTHSASIDY